MMIAQQIVYSRIAAIARELAETVVRTARSRGLAEGRCFATALLTGAPRVVAQVQHDANHIYLVRSSVAALLDYFAFDLADGDVVVVGDPFSGGSTPQCLTLALPVFHDGALRLFPAVRAELADLAGEFPGALHPLATETWQEAIRVTPVKLYCAGTLQRDVLRFLLRNSRAEALVRSDLEAIVAALRNAASSVSALLRDRGRTAIEQAVEAAIVHGRRLARASIARFPQGERSAARVLHQPEISPITVRATVCVGRDELAIHFGGSSAATRQPFNMTSGHARSFAYVAAFASLLSEAVLNEGMLDVLGVMVPAGSLLDAKLPAATGLAPVATGHLVASAVGDALFGAAAPAYRTDGPVPLMVAYQPIGSTANNPPLPLAPGFALAAQGWGAPILAGSAILPSAEIAETRDGFAMLARERDAAGQIRARVRNLLGALEANVFVPNGEIRLHAEGASRELASGVAIRVPAGAELDFIYPAYGEPME
jgi:N-methylhydantoinase B